MNLRPLFGMVLLVGLMLSACVSGGGYGWYGYDPGYGHFRRDRYHHYDRDDRYKDHHRRDHDNHNHDWGY